MNMTVGSVCRLAAILAALAGGAQASEVLFTITSDTSPTITFELPSNPIPDFVIGGDYFTIDNVHANVGGTPEVLPDVVFYASAQNGGLKISPYYDNTGDQYFSGTVFNPTFSPGPAFLAQPPFAEGGPTADVLISTVPEPAAWALMLVGFGGLGAAIRSRRKAVTAA
jgi:hypothetical protein